jgi:hypothetical protein
MYSKSVITVHQLFLVVIGRLHILINPTKNHVQYDWVFAEVIFLVLEAQSAVKKSGCQPALTGSQVFMELHLP